MVLNRTLALYMNDRDNVATLIEDAVAFVPVSVEEKSGRCLQEIIPQNLILRGHKIALNDISAGHNIIKYGEVIGKAAKWIAAGE